MLDWSKDGGFLAIIHDGKDSTVILWDSHASRAVALDTNEKAALTFIKWNRTGMMLAIGTAKGTLVLYNHQTTRKTPVLGKHSKAITCGTWIAQDELVLGGLDKKCSISSEDGNNLTEPLPLHGNPSCIQWHESGGSGSDGPPETTVSILLGNQTLYLWNSIEPENPIELEFQARYGSIVNYQWFGDRKVLIGFSSGHFIVVSTHMEHIGQELYRSKNHKTRLNDVTASVALNKAASCGDGCIKIHDLTDPSDMYGIIDLEDDRGMLDKMEWSDDGECRSAPVQALPPQPPTPQPTAS